MNKNGFVLAETLVVTIFVLIIFTILYNASVPLLGKYQELSYYDDLDVTYDLYQYKKILEKDENYASIVNHGYQIITCSDLNNVDICDEVDNILYKTIDDTLLFINTNHLDNVKNDNNVPNEIKDFIKYQNLSNNETILILMKNGYISYININLPDVPTIETNIINGTKYSSGYKNDLVLSVSCTSPEGIQSFSTTIDDIETGVYTENTTNHKTKSLSLDMEGHKDLKITCESNDGKVGTVMDNYTVYGYSESESCTCRIYKSCRSKKCGEEEIISYDGTCTCYTGGYSNSYDCNETRYIEIKGFGSCDSWCKNKNGNSSTGLGTCTKNTTNTYKTCRTAACGCEIRNSCWHT